MQIKEAQEFAITIYILEIDLVNPLLFSYIFASAKRVLAIVLLLLLLLFWANFNTLCPSLLCFHRWYFHPLISVMEDYS
jgi:hypothetical protein